MFKLTTKSNKNCVKKQSLNKMVGDEAEKQAKQYLLKQGLKFVCQQFRAPCGEIDLIMKDKDEIVFVEVRYLQNTAFIEPQETVNRTKQRHLINTALLFLQSREWTDDYGARFDIIGISGDQLNSKITWITDAFGVE